MNRFLGFAALTGFVLAAATHVFALAGVDVAEHFPSVWLLHVGIFVVFVPFVFSSRKVLGTRPSLADMRALVPGWVFFAGAAVWLYMMINFALFAAATQGGNPAVEAGKYVLKNHGRLIRELSGAEYEALRANELRGFSGHWLLFYFVPFAYFLFAKRPGSSNPSPTSV
ncbi:hypothetical protein ACEN88_07855 [Massilia sp. CT11-108]|uniref:hypothetical protein n=1 Tax=Massilia sp. CT11-108 TaxID=3393900 RepID=UPI0039A47B29